MTKFLFFSMIETAFIFYQIIPHKAHILMLLYF